MNSGQYKIGVLTYHNGPNFGGVLQAWHMVHAIRGLGHECHAVNYLHASHHKGLQKRVPVRNLKSLRARTYWELRKHGFKGFPESICRHPFTSNTNDVPWDDFDAFCVGSDVVWDYQSLGFGRDPVYFGEVPGLIGKPIMSYAASCGPASPDGPFPDYIHSGLKRFNAIGVRDAATTALVRNASGRESHLVVDPTWLGPDPVPRSGNLPKNKYLLIYGSRRTGPSTSDKIMAYCRKRGLECVSVMTPFKSADKMYRSLTPFQWVDLIRNAECVIVLGSLHGVAYSIKFGKPFMLIASAGSIQKISSMLDRTNQTHRMIDDEAITDESFSMLDPEQNPFPEIPAAWRMESMAFLRESVATMFSVKHS